MNQHEIEDFNKIAAIAGRDHPWDFGVSIYVRGYAHVSGLYAPTELEFESIEPAKELQKPLFYLKLDEAQVLIDSLWDCGLRPSQGKGSAGAMDATQKHLEDMRKIVASKLTVEL